MDMNLGRLWELVTDREAGMLQSMGSQSQTQLSDWTELKWGRLDNPSPTITNKITHRQMNTKNNNCQTESRAWSIMIIYWKLSSLSIWAAITKHHRLGSLWKNKLTSHSSRGCKSLITFHCCWVRTLFWVTVPHCIFMWQEGLEPRWNLFYKNANPILKHFTLMT